MESPQQKRLLLYQWIRLVKAMYPRERTINPFAAQITKLDFLTLEDRLLLEDALHCLTLLNGHSRLRSKGSLLSSQSDFLNAMNMVLPEGWQLESKAVSFHEALLNAFGIKPFTYYEASQRLKLSLRTISRRLKPLLLRGLVVYAGEGANRKSRFQAQPFEVAEITEPASIFEIMQGEWKDFVGFVEF